jgi:hypothetical protein
MSPSCLPVLLSRRLPPPAARQRRPTAERTSTMRVLPVISSKQQHSPFVGGEFPQSETRRPRLTCCTRQQQEGGGGPRSTNSRRRAEEVVGDLLLLAAERSRKKERSLRRPKRLRLLSLPALPPLSHSIAMRLEDVDLDALTARRQCALAHPLEAGDSLSPSGPSLDPSAITPAPNDPLCLHEQDIATQSPNPYRPPNSRLRDLLSRTPLPSSLRFELNEPRRADEDRWAQVWTAKFRRPQARR